VGDDVVSLGLEVDRRKLIVLQLQFLQSHDVGLAGPQPMQNEVEPGTEAVDVPGGDAHAANSPDATFPIIRQSVLQRRNFSDRTIVC